MIFQTGFSSQIKKSKTKVAGSIRFLNLVIDFSSDKK